MPPPSSGGDFLDTRLVPGQHAFETDRTIVAYFVRGKGPPCFVAPYPWGMNSEPIRSFFRPLEKRLTMIYHDPPGSGRSGPPARESDLGLMRVVTDMFALQNRLGIPKAVFMGHSGGSACALVYALRYPARVNSLILIGSGSKLPDVLKSKEVGDVVAIALEERNDENFRRVQARLLGPEIRTRQGKLAMGRAMKSSIQFSIERAAYNLNELGNWNVRQDLGKLAVRTLIIGGKHDKLTPPKFAKGLHRGIKDSELVIFDDSGHFPFLDEPKKFFDTVTKFLKVGKV